MKRVRIFGALLCVFLMFAAALPVSASEGVTLAAFSFDNTGAVAEEGIKDNGYGDKDTGYFATEGSGLLFASVDGTNARKLEWSKDDYSGLGMQPVMSGGMKNPWADGAHIDVKVSTVGFDSITFSATLGGTNKGPRDFKLLYSTDGLSFQDTGVTYTLKDNKEMETAFDNVALPSDAANAPILYIRMAVASETLVNGGTGLFGSTSGETAVNNVVVRGTGDGNALPTVQEGAAGGEQSGDEENATSEFPWGLVAMIAVMAVVVVAMIVFAVKRVKKAKAK